MSVGPPEDVEDFIERVDEVARLIDGLAAGRLPPDYIDRRIEEQRQKQEAAAARRSSGQKGANATSRNASAGQGAGGGADDQQEEERQAELMRKVEELKASRARKLKARARYEEYVKQHKADLATTPAGGIDGPARTAGGVDYARWDLWCPSDEEDDLFNSLTPDNAGFRAMERDINERHKRMVEQRQLAERQRVAGNQAMASKQWSEALRCYEVGLDAQRHSMVLHANAALAALKLQNFVQALEHCDKVLHLAEALHGTPNHPLCIKALQRRAAAREGLGHFSQAAKDLERALGMAGGEDAEIKAHLSHIRALESDTWWQRGLKQRFPSKQRADDNRCCAINIELVQIVEQDVGQLLSLLGKGPRWGGDVATAPSRLSTEAIQQCRRLAGLLVGDSDYRRYFRNWGGVKAASYHIVQCSASVAAPSLPPKPSKPELDPTGGSGGGDLAVAADVVTQAQAALLGLLVAATLDELALEEAAADWKLMAAVVRLLGSASPEVQAGALQLLQAASVAAKSRMPVCSMLTAQQGKGLARLLTLTVHTKDRAVQTAALSLAGNCLLQSDIRAVAAQLLSGSQGSMLVEGIVGLLEPGCCPTTPLEIQAKAASMLGNACAHPGLRLLLASDRLLAALLWRAFPNQGAAPASEEHTAAGEASAGCLLNLLAEPAAQELLAGNDQHLRQLLDICCSNADATWAVVQERLAGALARIAKHPAGADALARLGAAPTLVQTLSAWNQRIKAGVSATKTSTAAAHPPPGSAWLDGVVRALTALMARPGACSALSHHVQVKAIVDLVAICSDQAPEVLAGNAALCLSYLVGEPQLPAALLRAGGVDALLAVTRTRRGSAASRNAAIALAKAAKDIGVLERLRELRALEVIVEYVPAP